VVSAAANEHEARRQSVALLNRELRGVDGEQVDRGEIM
jgi:hypothetical protein